jgi:hypothetical protein
MIFIYIRTKQKLEIDFSLLSRQAKNLFANAQKVLYNFIDLQQKYSSGDPVPLKTNGTVQVIS